LLIGADASAIGKAWERMFAAVRNLGSRGVCANAISAVDTALWELRSDIPPPLASILQLSNRNTAKYAPPVLAVGAVSGPPGS
jgi:hypothetical protein